MDKFIEQAKNVINGDYKCPVPETSGEGCDGCFFTIIAKQSKKEFFFCIYPDNFLFAAKEYLKIVRQNMRKRKLKRILI